MVNSYYENIMLIKSPFFLFKNGAEIPRIIFFTNVWKRQTWNDKRQTWNKSAVLSLYWDDLFIF